MVALVILMGWIVVIATDRYIDKQIKNNHDEPEPPHTEDFTSMYSDEFGPVGPLAGSEMPNEMVDAIVDKPKRGRPKKNG